MFDWMDVMHNADAGLIAAFACTGAAVFGLSLLNSEVKMALRLTATLSIFLSAGLALGGAAWGWLAAAIPALIVIQHAGYVVLIKPRFIPATKRAQPPAQPTEQPAGQPTAQSAAQLRPPLPHPTKPLPEEAKKAFKSEIEGVREASERYFGQNTIALRYGIPTLALFCTCVTTYYVLNPATTFFHQAWFSSVDGEQQIKDASLEAARFGALGAYLYVVLFLGRRGLQHDVSTGAVVWAAATLATGPFLAVVCSKLWPDVAPTKGELHSGTQLAIYFAAGFSPQAVTVAIQEVARRLLGQPTQTVPEKTVPLTKIRGMNQLIIDRLAEEGIYDVTALAMTDVVRMQRDCNFDKRQLLSWVDEALLFHALPNAADKLIQVGLTGASDLAWYWGGSQSKTIENVKRLKDAAGLEPELLADVVRRLWEDAQVRVVWVLYQLESSVDVGTSGPNSEVADS